MVVSLGCCVQKKTVFSISQSARHTGSRSIIQYPIPFGLRLSKPGASLRQACSALAEGFCVNGFVFLSAMGCQSLPPKALPCRCRSSFF
ncbi:MAG: hypothetical protein EOO27_36070 [Comamonadaceae bacterium]|nr:MAG: hypothetical protein EOO27_36070 [Comamonadaceae bacterium]